MAGLALLDHAHRAGLQVQLIGAGLTRDAPARAGVGFASGVAGLDDEVRDRAVEREAIVEAALLLLVVLDPLELPGREPDEVRDRLRRTLVERTRQHALRRGDGRDQLGAVAWDLADEVRDLLAGVRLQRPARRRHRHLRRGLTRFGRRRLGLPRQQHMSLELGVARSTTSRQRHNYNAEEGLHAALIAVARPRAKHAVTHRWSERSRLCPPRP